MSIDRVDQQSRFNYTGADKSSANVIKGKDKNLKSPKKNNLPASKNDPGYSDNAQLKARNKQLEGMAYYDDSIQQEAKLKARKESLGEAVHYHDSIQTEVKKAIKYAIKKGEIRADKKSGETTAHYQNNIQAEVNKVIKTAIKKGEIQVNSQKSGESATHYHDAIQTEVNKSIKEAIKKGEIRFGKKSREEAKQEWDQFSKDTAHQPKKEQYFEFIHTKGKQTDEAQESGAAAQATTSSVAEATKAGSKKVLTIDAHLKIAEDGSTSYLHATFSDPSIEELYHTIKISDAEVKSLDATMKKFFLPPLKRDITLRVMTLFLNSLSKEFLAQLDYEIVQTKLKVSSIMAQKDELMGQAIAKLAGGIAESLVTAGAAGLSIGSASGGLNELTEGTADTKVDLKESNETIDTIDNEIASNKTKLKNLQEKKEDLEAKNISKEASEYKEIEKQIKASNEEIEKQTILKTQAQTHREGVETDQRTLLRKIDLKVAKLNGFSQLISSGKGFINGMTDYYVTISQANMKIQDAIQAQLQLTKDNARMFMQKSNEYITSLLSSLLAIINSIYQARRGIITS